MEDLPDVGVLLTHADHDTLVTGTTDDGARGRKGERDGDELFDIADWSEGGLTGRQHEGHRHLGRIEDGERRR